MLPGPIHRRLRVLYTYLNVTLHGEDWRAYRRALDAVTIGSSVSTARSRSTTASAAAPDVRPSSTATATRPAIEPGPRPTRRRSCGPKSYCETATGVGAALVDYRLRAEVHHVIPCKDDGPDHPANAETVCRKCHRSADPKGSRRSSDRRAPTPGHRGHRGYASFATARPIARKKIFGTPTVESEIMGGDRSSEGSPPSLPTLWLLRSCSRGGERCSATPAARRLRGPFAGRRNR